MNAAAIHSVLASCVAQPERIGASNKLDPSFAHEVESIGLSPDDFDPAALRRMAGFVTKVRHNPLRPHLPATFRALDRLEIEIELFSQYAPRFVALRNAGNSDEAARGAAFVAFLDETLAATGDVRVPAALIDVANHEWLTCPLAARAWPQRDAQPVNRRASDPAGPRIRGSVTMRAATCDPERAIATVLADADLTAIPHEECTIAYVLAPGTTCARVHHLDPLTALVLPLVDGHQTPATLTRRLRDLGVEGVAEDLIDRVLTACEHRGLLHASEPSHQGREPS